MSMAEKMPQNFANHVKFDPLFHFFLLPVAAITIILAVYNLIRNFGFSAAWMLVLSIAFAVLIFKARVYALKAQDRVIRLEERLRLAMLLPEPLRSRIPELTEGQLVALRFAPDGEVAALADKALSSKMRGAEIKKGIVNWRPDYFRI
jgi:Family of unknown function (DUF6526)